MLASSGPEPTSSRRTRRPNRVAASAAAWIANKGSLPAAKRPQKTKSTSRAMFATDAKASLLAHSGDLNTDAAGTPYWR